MSKGGETEFYNIFCQQNKNNGLKNLFKQYLHQVKIPCLEVEQVQIYVSNITGNEILVAFTKVLNCKS